MSAKFSRDEESYRAALKTENGYLLIIGESGFEHLLTYPVTHIHASLHAISLLMLDLESLSWGPKLSSAKMEEVSTAGYEAWIEYDELKPGDPVERGEITTGLWLSPALSEFDIADQVLDVLSGKSARITLRTSQG